MICKDLETLERELSREKANADPETGWSDNVFRLIDEIKDHQREGHDGNPCPGD
jgi:hypothetical protein